MPNQVICNRRFANLHSSTLQKQTDCSILECLFGMCQKQTDFSSITRKGGMLGKLPFTGKCTPASWPGKPSAALHGMRTQEIFLGFLLCYDNAVLCILLEPWRGGCCHSLQGKACHVSSSAMVPRLILCLSHQSFTQYTSQLVTVSCVH